MNRALFYQRNGRLRGQLMSYTGNRIDVSNKARTINQIHQFIPSVRWNIALYSTGMEAFLEFEREMAKKRKFLKPNATKPSKKILAPPVPPRDDECCHLDCPNCVLLVYQEKLLEWELNQSENDTSINDFQTKQNNAIPRYQVNRIAISDQELEPQDRNQLEQNRSRHLLSVTRNERITTHHKTKDHWQRHVHHLELAIDCYQQKQLLETDYFCNIAIYVPNPIDMVERLAKRLGLNLDEVYNIIDTDTKPSVIERPFPTITTVKDALIWSFDWASPPRVTALRHLSAYAKDAKEANVLANPQNVALEDMNFMDVLNQFPSIQLTFEQLYNLAPRNAPRYYSIASSISENPDHISMTIGHRIKDGVRPLFCSTYLSHLKRQEQVFGVIFPSVFQYPKNDTEKPILLISAGTGIAVCRAFLQEAAYERRNTGINRDIHLFYGCRAPDIDYLYHDEINKAIQQKILASVHVAYSDISESHPSTYTQDLILQHQNTVLEHIIERNGYVYICGGRPMGRAVKDTLFHLFLQTIDTKLQKIDRENRANTMLEDRIASGQIVVEYW